VTFTGFPEQALVFFEGLEADNSKSYWTDHRSEYDDAVRAPMEALMAELEGEFGTGKIFRPYRDVRFSKDKTPYKTWIGGHIPYSDGAGSAYIQLSAEGLMAAGGLHSPAPDQLDRMRRAVADDVVGAELTRVVAALRRGGYGVGGNPTTRMPRGFTADHPRADLLRHRSLHASRQWEPAAWLGERTALTRVRTALRAYADLNRWLAGNVGATARAG
jgi:uncharacterized protein (TIGR02453 family)